MSQSQVEPNPDKESLHYANSVRKGQKLLDMMRADDHAAGQMFDPPRESAESQFLEQKCLDDWGYTRLSIPRLSDWPSDTILPALGMDTSKLPVEIRDSHNRSFSIDGVIATATDADFRNVVDRRNGLFVALTNHGPDYCVGDSGKPVPDLKHWSDIAYLQWCDPDASRGEHSRLKYVLRHEIENEETRAIVRQIEDDYRRMHGMKDDWKPLWPGIALEVDSEQAKALLGTPNGHGVAWLLIQHKRQLGHMVVDKTMMFSGDPAEGYRLPSLLFRLDEIQS